MLRVRKYLLRHITQKEKRKVLISQLDESLIMPEHYIWQVFLRRKSYTAVFF